MPRKQYEYHYIYKTTCLITGRYYIGMHSTSNLEDEYIGSGQRLWKSIRKHGRENHVKEILEWFEDRSSLKNREKELVNENLIQDPNCMNLVIGGDGGFTKTASISGGKATSLKRKNDIELDLRLRKISSDKLKNQHKLGLHKYNTFEGKKHSEETKKKIGNANSISQKGSNNSQYGTCWITKENENKKISKDLLNEYLSLGWNKGRK